MSGIPKRLWDLTGQRFGRWTVLNRAPSDRYRRRFWNCRCECGTERAVSSNTLRRYATHASCGCYFREVLVARATHGHSRRASGKHAKSSTYRCWQNMMMRCYRTTYRKFHNYGGRGIRVCDQWHRFEQFLADMGEKPTDLTLERINNEGDYNPKNCRWASYREQSRNRRVNRLLTANDETHVLEDWAVRLGVAPSVIRGRLQRGWTVEEAVSLPSGRTHLARRREDQAMEVTY